MIIDSNTQFVMYADDSAAVISANTPTELQQHVNSFINNYVQCTHVHGLKINVKKCEMLPLFNTAKCNINVHLHNTIVEPKAWIKFLGVYIDAHLNWREHIARLTSKARATLATLRTAAQILTGSALRLAANAFTQYYFNYCITIWGGVNPNSLSALAKIQTRIFILLAKKHALSLIEFLQKFKALDIRARYQVNCTYMLYDVIHNLKCIDLFNYRFNNMVHVHFTRASN